MSVLLSPIIGNFAGGINYLVVFSYYLGECGHFPAVLAEMYVVFNFSVVKFGGGKNKGGLWVTFFPTWEDRVVNHSLCFLNGALL